MKPGASVKIVSTGKLAIIEFVHRNAFVTVVWVEESGVRREKLHSSLIELSE